ncbi:hypothetical protein C1280_03040 [Gemmata obscuriglobus]|uniref:Uncharacterized protein n=2 Tax=Gemmata obscuriglobus TaxID=114 RepID=A0A2Z3GZ07_9BACT|nr:hypothetical protein C1280_03040 [Gemmata obscuriglobus]
MNSPRRFGSAPEPDPPPLSSKPTRSHGRRLTEPAGSYRLCSRASHRGSLARFNSLPWREMAAGQAPGTKGRTRATVGTTRPVATPGTRAPTVRPAAPNRLRGARPRHSVRTPHPIFEADELGDRIPPFGMLVVANGATKSGRSAAAEGARREPAPRSRRGNRSNRRRRQVMAIRQGAPWLAAIAVLSVGSVALAGHFGTTKYAAGNGCSPCDAQTNFAAGQGPCSQQVVYDCVVEKRYHTCYQTTCETVLKPVTKTTYACEEKTCFKTVNETAYKQVQETICKPVCETVLKPCRTTVCKQVCETVYRDCPVTVCKTVCEPHTRKECFFVCKPVCETHYKDCTRTVCKPVCETVIKDVCKTVCVPVTETCYKDVQRTVCHDVCEMQYKTVCKTVCEPQCVTKCVTKCVPEAVCETVCVPGKLTWECVPVYKCEFDPCTCTTVQKQVGTKKKLVRSPATTETRQVTRSRKVTEQVQETVYVKRTVSEKVPVQVTKKVQTVVSEKVPVTVTRNVQKTVVEKVPTQVVRNVQSTEVVRTPVQVKRNAQGAYVDASALNADAKAQADKGASVLGGGPGALANPNAPTYDAGGPGRVFVEGLRVSRDVTYNVTRQVQVTENRRVAEKVVRNVQEEVVKMVPTKVTTMKQEVVTKCVPYTVTKQVPYTVTVKVPRTVTEMVPTTVTKRVPVTVATDVIVKKARYVPAPAAPCGCGTPCTTGKGDACSAKPCGDACSPICSSGLGGGLRNVLNDPNRPKPIRDFFSNLCATRLACDPCPPAHCGDACSPCK